MTNEKRILQDLVMTDAELSELTEKYMENLTVDTISDIIIEICQKGAECGKEWEDANRFTKLTYISRGMYRKGFIDALWLMNESIRVICSRT